jgi:deoxyribodipyrimidine photolyase
MSPQEQQARGVAIGRDYPAPIVDHDRARKLTLELFGKIRNDRPKSDQVSCT